jgi:DNA-binding IclR family transcriptional regulator
MQTTMPTPPDRDPAPAVTRGLQLLTYLNREGASSLDRLARATELPKASILRLLRSMEASGAVARDGASKRWRSRLRLVRGGEREDLLRSACSEASIWLCKAAKQTVEVYLFDSGRLEMIDRSEPDGVEVTVRARVGFVRTWEDADAVVLVGLGFGFPANAWPQVTRHWLWRDRVRTSVARRDIEAMVAQARARGWSADASVNSNGVRRFAAPLLDATGALVGVIAIAQAPATLDRADDRLCRLVAGAARRIGPIATDPTGAKTPTVAPAKAS